MTRKHVEAVAAAFKLALDDVRNKEPLESYSDMRDGVTLAAEHVASALWELNRSFDQKRFLRDCGVPS